jgi:hypothetical protein
VPEVTCSDVRDLAAEYSLRILPSLDRSAVERHLEGCPACRYEMEVMYDVGSRLLDTASDKEVLHDAAHPSGVVPGSEPPRGFEARAMDGMETGWRPPGQRGLTRRRYRAAVALAAAVIAVAMTLGADISRGGYLQAGAAVSAALRQGNRYVGAVVIHAGKPPWLEMAVTSLSARGPVTCEVVSSGGTVTDLGSFALVRGSGYWYANEPTATEGVTGVGLVDQQGDVLAWASFAAQSQ